MSLQGSCISQHQRALDFQRLHTHSGPFVMPNPWDAGTARLLENAGFKALGTTSAGLAVSLGRLDRLAEVSLDETLANANMIVRATTLPVSGDLEDGFGHSPSEIANTIKRAAAAGLVGGSLEDYSGNSTTPIRSLSDSVERIEAAADAAKHLDYPFTITARAENFLYGVYDLSDTIARLQAYSAAGAHVLYAPCLPDAASIKAVCSAVNRPVNVLMAAGNKLSIQELFELGVTRVSLGSALSRCALGAFMKALTELKDFGTCEFAEDAVGYFDVIELLTNKNK